jgi:hypothetical protein
MPVQPTRCIFCGKAGERELDGLDLMILEREPFPLSWEADDIPVPEYDPSRILCGECASSLEARFSRRGHCTEGTLVELLAQDHELFLGSVGERLTEDRDPDALAVKELFPGVALPRPRGRRHERNQPAMAEVLRRLGRPVCYRDPVMGDYDQPYLLYFLNDEGAACSAHVGLFELAELGDVACAADYNLDGIPLAEV